MQAVHRCTEDFQFSATKEYSMLELSYFRL
uniref:Uncharacterized protein n=1 Tax=Arundo donax TaxID=35708 RepID=A0A0A8YED1_ARUDO